jgi:hypothetical protein
VRTGQYGGYTSYIWNPSSSTGVIAGNNGNNVINLKIAYSGTAQPVGTWIVEEYDGSTYPYPI